MMLGVYITLSIILLFVLLLLLPVKLKVVLREDRYFLVRYLFFKYRFDFSKDKKAENKDQSKAQEGKQPKEGYFKQLVKKNGILDAILEILNIIKLGFENLLIILKKVKIKWFSLKIRAGCEDAAQTAITYGATHAAVYSTVAAINGLFPVKKQEVVIDTDFDNQVFEYSFSAVISVRLYYIVAAAVSFIIQLTKNKLQQKNKDGAKNG